MNPEQNERTHAARHCWAHPSGVGGLALRLRRAAGAVAMALFLAGCAAAAGVEPAASRSALLNDAGPATSRLAPDAWVEQTLGSLTLREKVGQMVMPWIGADYISTDSPEFDQLVALVQEQGVGGFILSVGLPHSYAAKIKALQRRAEVPLLIASDMENGPGMRMAGIYSFPHLLPQGGGTAFPPVMALGAIGAEEMAYALGRVLGEEARAVGVHMTFGPVLDVNSNPLNPIINTRSFGEDPARVAALGKAYIEGARSAGLMTTAKHFPGHGDTSVDSHIDLPTIPADRARMDSVELYPFREAVRAGVDGVMTAHIAVVGVEGADAPPATLSPYFMTEVLREEMGFDGILFTDALDMGAVAKRYPDGDAAVLAIEAGADVLLMPRDVPRTIARVVTAVEDGRLPEARIDESVRRLLQAKAEVGLHRDRIVELEAVDERVATRGHTAIAQEIADRSITLARDTEGVVPLRGAQEILSITYAESNDPIAGRVFNRTLRGGGRTVQEARVDSRSAASELDELLRRAESVDAVIVTASVSPREYTGSVGADEGVSAFVRRLAELEVPLVVVSFGSPYLLDAFPDVPSYLLAWGGQEVSQRAAAKALLGEIAITGTLPVSLPPHHRRGDGIVREVTSR